MSTKPTNVLDSKAADYVLPVPAPLRQSGEVVVVAPRRDAEFSFHRGAETAKGLGERFSTLAEHQQLLLGELRDRLMKLDAEVAESSRAQLKGALREVLTVLDWVDVAEDDLLRESRLAHLGAEPIDVAALCLEVADNVALPDQPIYVAGEMHAPWWGDAAALAGLVREALALVAERTNGLGTRRIEVREESHLLRIAIRSTGDPADGIEASSVARFRRACEQLGAVVRPDELGFGGSGLVLELPAPEAL